MKKLILVTLFISIFTFSGDLMADRLDDLKAQFQQRHDAMKADTENTRGYTLRHLMIHSGIRHTLALADHFDMADVTKKAALDAKKASAAEHLSRVTNEQSRELLQFIVDQLTAAADQNSAEPLLDLAEKEVAAFDRDGETPLDAKKLQLWLVADDVQHAQDLEDKLAKLDVLASLAKTVAMTD